MVGDEGPGPGGGIRGIGGAVATAAIVVNRPCAETFAYPTDPRTRHEPPNRQDIRTTGGPIRPTGVLRCEQQSDGTLVSYEFTFTGPAAWFFARTISRNMKAALARTKKRLESH